MISAWEEMTTTGTWSQRRVLAAMDTEPRTVTDIAERANLWRQTLSRCRRVPDTHTTFNILGWLAQRGQVRQEPNGSWWRTDESEPRQPSRARARSKVSEGA